MKWIQIPDNMFLEASGFQWSEEPATPDSNAKINGNIEDQNVADAKAFHLRYAYDLIRQTLYLDIIEDQVDDNKRLLLSAGIHEKPDHFHHAVAAIENAFPQSAIVTDHKCSRLSKLVDLYEADYSELPQDYLDERRAKLVNELTNLFDAYEYTKNSNDNHVTLAERFENVVAVDFQSGKKAYKPDDDLLEQMRGAIAQLHEQDSPIIQIFGSAYEPS